MSERDELKALITNVVDEITGFTASSNDFDYAIADALIEAGYQKIPKDINWRTENIKGYLSPVGYVVTNPLFDYEVARVAEYHRTFGSTPWKPVEDDE